MSEITRRQEFMAQLFGEALAVALGLWMIFGLGWREFGPLLVVFGAGGFVVTCVRHWKSRSIAGLG